MCLPPKAFPTATCTRRDGSGGEGIDAGAAARRHVRRTRACHTFGPGVRRDQLSGGSCAGSRVAGWRGAHRRGWRVGEVRTGGFGGVAGRRRRLVESKVDAVVDATHPYAATITANAAVVCD